MPFSFNLAETCSHLDELSESDCSLFSAASFLLFSISSRSLIMSLAIWIIWLVQFLDFGCAVGSTEDVEGLGGSIVPQVDLVTSQAIVF